MMFGFLNCRIAYHSVPRVSAPAGCFSLYPGALSTSSRFQVFQGTSRSDSMRRWGQHVRFTCSWPHTCRIWSLRADPNPGCLHKYRVLALVAHLRHCGSALEQQEADAILSYPTVRPQVQLPMLAAILCRRLVPPTESPLG